MYSFTNHTVLLSEAYLQILIIISTGGYIHTQSNGQVLQRKVWQIYCFQAFGEKKFGKLTKQYSSLDDES